MSFVDTSKYAYIVKLVYSSSTVTSRTGFQESALDRLLVTTETDGLT